MRRKVKVRFVERDSGMLAGKLAVACESNNSDSKDKRQRSGQEGRDC